MIKKRTDFEYVLCRRQLTPQDYYTYLQYEIRLEELRALRCFKITKNGEQKKELQNKFRALHSNFMRHICYIFDRGVRRFPHELSMWEDYLSFLKSKKAYSIMNTVLGKALSLHPTTESFWLQAAVFELDVQNNSHAARVLLQRSLRLNKHSKLLWLRYFELEVWNVVKLQERSNILHEGTASSAASRVVSIAAPMVVYKHAIIAVPEVSLAVSLHAACSEGDIHAGVAAAVLGEMQATFGGELDYWKYVVANHLRQFASRQQQQQRQQLRQEHSTPAGDADETVAGADTDSKEESLVVAVELVPPISKGKRKHRYDRTAVETEAAAEAVVTTVVPPSDAPPPSVPHTQTHTQPLLLLLDIILQCSAFVDQSVGLLRQATEHVTAAATAAATDHPPPPPSHMGSLVSDTLQETVVLAKNTLSHACDHFVQSTASSPPSVSPLPSVSASVSPSGREAMRSLKASLEGLLTFLQHTSTSSSSASTQLNGGDDGDATVSPATATATAAEVCVGHAIWVLYRALAASGATAAALSSSSTVRGSVDVRQVQQWLESNYAAAVASVSAATTTAGAGGIISAADSWIGIADNVLTTTSSIINSGSSSDPIITAVHAQQQQQQQQQLVGLVLASGPMLLSSVAGSTLFQRAVELFLPPPPLLQQAEQGGAGDGDEAVAVAVAGVEAFIRSAISSRLADATIRIEWCMKYLHLSTTTVTSSRAAPSHELQEPQRRLISCYQWINAMFQSSPHFLLNSDLSGMYAFVLEQLIAPMRQKKRPKSSSSAASSTPAAATVALLRSIAGDAMKRYVQIDEFWDTGEEIERIAGNPSAANSIRWKKNSRSSNI